MLMVGHLLEYHPGVAKLKEIADGGELGDIHYIYSNRLNLGKLRADENALWSLGAHDVSVAAAPGRRGALRGRGARRVLHAPRASRTSCSASCASRPGLAAHLHLSWLDPHKERRFTVVGSRRMATFDDMDLERKVTIYDKGFDEDAALLRRVHHALGRHLEPAHPQPRAAAARVRALRECVREGRAPRLGRRSGLRVVRVLAGLQAAARRVAPGAACSRLTARPGCVLGDGRRGSARASAFGAHVVVHAGTVIGDGCEIQDGAILGKPPKLARHSSAPREPPPPLVLGAGRRRVRAARSCSRARRSARARSSATSPTCASARGSAPARVIGRGSCVDNDVAIGARVRVQTDVYLTAFSEIEDDVFVGPGACTTNDDTMSRHAPEYPLRGARCGARAGSAAGRCCARASRSARRRSWRPARSSRATCRRARS